MKLRFLTCILCALMLASVFLGCSKEPSADVTFATEQSYGEESGSEPDRVEGAVSTPDETGARLGKIQGYTQKNSVSTHTLPQPVGDGAVTVVSIGEYTGAYIEDGTDMQIEKIAAIVVQNTSSKPIQHATVSLGSGEEKLYTFSFSTIPAGCSALVLETDKKLFSNEKDITSFTSTVTNCDELATNSDKIKVTYENGTLKLKNLTDTDFRGVYVRYKNFTAGNVYYGGITYSASFDNVGAKGNYEFKAAHYYEDFSQILMVQIVE